MKLPQRRDFQFVWWGFRGWTLGFHRFGPEESLHHIYRWTFMVGPLEIRRWVKPPKEADDGTA